MNEQGKGASIHIFCGKMASGKSTLARELAQKHNAILLVEDDWMSQLYPAEISDIQSYIKYSERLKGPVSGHVLDLLAHGMSVVMDFPANTINQRRWFRELFEKANVRHALHYLDVSDAICKQQLRQRSAGRSEGSAFTTAAEFDAITKYFQPPDTDEGFNVIRYEREGQGASNLLTNTS